MSAFRRIPTLQRIIVLLGGALIAVAWRVPQLRWGLPDVEEEALPMKKAFEMWGWESGRLTLDPQTVGWPSLSFYVQLALQKAQYWWGHLGGSYVNPYDYWLQYQLDPSAITTVARASSVAFGVGVVLIAMLGALRLSGWRAAISVGLLLACCPLAIQFSQLVTPDILVMFFAALACLALLRLEERGHRRDYVLAGLWIGLGAASKYTPVLLAPVLYVLHLRRRRQEGLPLRALGFDDLRLGYAALAALLAFCVASPYTFADLDILRRDFGYQAMHMSRGHFGQEGGGFGPLYYLRRVLAPALGWPALLASLAGLAVGARRRPSASLVFASYFLGLAFLSTQFDRYVLPLLLPLGWGLAQLWSWLAPRIARSGVRSAVWVVATGLLLISPVGRALDYHRSQARKSTQLLAKQFILERLPVESTTLALENYTVFLPYTREEEWKRSPVFARLDEAQRAKLLDQPLYRYQVIPMYSARTELAAYYYDLRHYLAYDWILTSSSVRGRYERQPERYPEQNRFYRDLEKYCELVQRFAPGEDARGPEIRFHRFRPEGADALLRDRGPLPLAHWEQYRERLHPPHFFSFLDQTALHALDENRYDVAERYYTVERAVCAPEERLRVSSQLAYTKVRLRKWSEAVALYREVLRQAPDDAVALGNMAYALWQLGEKAEAREHFERCIRAAGEGSTAEWARQRLAELDAEG